jgi:hypothetical protein
LGGQGVPSAPDGDVVERILEDRWIQGSRLPDRVPWDLREEARRVRVEDGAFRLVHTSGPSEDRSPVLRLVPGAPGGEGRLWTVEVPDAFESQAASGSGVSREDRIQARLGYRGGDRPFPFPAFGWDLVVTVPEGRTEWSDTLDEVAEFGGWRYAWRAERTFRVVGDTLVGGVAHPVVEERSRIRLEEGAPERRVLSSPVSIPARITRTAEGELRGRLVLAPGGGVILARDDTLALEGSARIDLEDGRSRTVPARYEAVRTDRRHPPEDWEALVAARRQEQIDRRGGMVRFVDPDADPPPEVETDPMVDAGAREAALLRGDTAWVLDRLVDGLARQGGILPDVDPAVLALLEPLVRDPTEAFRHGIPSDRVYENLVHSLRTWGPLLADEPGRVTCGPELCGWLRALDRNPSGLDPRAVEVAVFARALTDPAAHAAELRALEGSATPLLALAFDLARGVGATWPAAQPRVPLPDPGSPSEDWTLWMLGGAAAPGAPLRFQDSHLQALAFHRAETGRDFAAEWQGQFEAAPSDSARLVFGYLLHQAEAEAADPEQVRALLLSDREELRQLGIQQVTSLFSGRSGVGMPGEPGEAANVVDDPELVELLDRYLAYALLGPPGLAGDRSRFPWPQVGEDGDVEAAPPAQARPDPRVVLSGRNLPDPLRAQWEERVRIVTDEEQEGWDPRAPRLVYTFEAPVRVGSFVRIGFRILGYHAREAHQTPGGWARWETLYLVLTPAGWRVATSLFMIT